MKNNFIKIRRILKENQRVLLPTTLLIGFIVDFFTLNRADQVFDNIILLAHLFIVATSIFLLFITNSNSKIRVFLPYLMQYSFGNLFSGMIILYARSGAIITSLPFLMTLVTLLISNEFIHKKNSWLTLQISLFFVSLISYTTLITPVLFREISTSIFIIGTLSAIILIGKYKI